jgi:hypothetical protein
VARDIDYRKASSLFCAGLKICLNEDLDRLLAGINFDADRRITEIYLVSATVAPRMIACVISAPPLTELPSRRLTDVVSYPKIQSDGSRGQEDMGSSDAIACGHPPVSSSGNSFVTFCL